MNRRPFSSTVPAARRHRTTDRIGWTSGGLRRAFTLVEVLVVMSIIGLLAALLIPITTAVRDRAAEAECLSNLYQAGVAVEAYRQQYDRILPRAAPLPSGDPFSPPDGLPGALQHFIPLDSPVHRCAADHDHGTDIIGTSYFYVAGAFMFLYPPDPYPAARQVTLFFETQALNSIPIVWDSADRHFTGTDLPRNGLYLDGHTERVGEPFTIPE